MAQPAFDWSTFLPLAEALAKAPSEASNRTAIGRAYYYVLHLAKQRLIDNGFVIIEGADSHRQVWEKFEGGNDKCRQLAMDANKLKGKRVDADYKSEYRLAGKEVQVIIGAAKKFADDLAKLDTELPKNTGMPRWMKTL